MTAVSLEGYLLALAADKVIDDTTVEGGGGGGEGGVMGQEKEKGMGSTCNHVVMVTTPAAGPTPMGGI